MLVLARLVTAVAGHDIFASLKRARRSAIVYAVAGLLFLTAYAAATAAVAIYLAEELGSVAGVLVVAAAAALLGAVLVAGVAILNGIERRRNASRVMAASTAAALLPAVMRSRPLLSLATAVAIVLIPGQSTSGSSD